MSKKFTFADLQPHVDMLCDALENKGASPSGVPYNDAVYPYAKMYRELLADIRNLKISHESLLNVLDSYKQSIFIIFIVFFTISCDNENYYDIEIIRFEKKFYNSDENELDNFQNSNSINE